ncbi:MAG: CDP-glycerol glycerophosphotransferase family protein [Vagococcus sp.]|uniref:CDP-glycerol glycerophosphotransferase family protein n=1 Tax=Vagococcus sp. TaxID=1933889 RepID=UPI002FC68AA9
MGAINKAMRLVGPAVLPKISYHKKMVDQYTNFYKSEEVEKKTVLYESRDGKSLTDSPFAIFEYLLETDKDKNYTHIWTITPSPELEKVMTLYNDHSNVQFVVRNSEEYLKWLTKAEFLINNSTFQPFVTIKKDQTYINTWHGTPLKTMGYDIPGNPADAKNVVRNFFMADYLISPNQHTTDMFVKSYRLLDNYTGQIIEDGYPRIDQTFKKNVDQLLKTLFDFDVKIDLSKEILLYTPTWKGGNLSASKNEVAQIHHEMDMIRKKFGDKYNVLIKVHPFLYDEAKDYEELVPFLIPDIIDTNRLLGVVDLLVTDYSSIFFDYLVTDKPILFYCWDDDLYSNKRGKYFEYEELPGPVAFNIEELMVKIETLDEQKEIFKNNYEIFKKRFVSYDDGYVTKRLVDIIFNQKKHPQVKIIEPTSDKKRLLIYPGGMRSNGITSSFINLMENIDFNEYDVTCFLDNINTMDQIKNVSFLPKNISLLFRFEIANYTIKERYKDLNLHMHGVKNSQRDNYPVEMYEREVRRLLGNQRFDVAIDFSGYSLNWSKYVLGAKADKYICYLHSDMMQDREREVNGRKIHKMNLQGIFSVYHKYDYLVSVSEAISEVNKEKLEKYAEADKFVFATNTIDPDKILGKKVDEEIEEVFETEVYFRDGRIIDQEEEHVIRTSRPDMVLGNRQLRTFKDSHINILGKFTYNGEDYYKFTQQQEYVGWINAKEVEVEPTKILSEKPVSYFAKINTRAGSYLYTEPIGLEESYPLSPARSLKNIYVQIDEEVTTQEETSVKIKLGGKELGWLPKSRMTFSRRLNWTKDTRPSFKVKLLRQLALTINHLERRGTMKSIAYRPLMKKVIESYFLNSTTHSIKGYSYSTVTSEMKTLGVLTVIYVKSICDNSNGRWVEVVDEAGDTWWIQFEELILSPILEETILFEKEINDRVSFLTQEVPVFVSKDNCLADKSSLAKALPGAVAIREFKTSLSREFVLIEWEEKELWVEKERIIIEPLDGILNSSDELVPFPDKNKINIVTTGRLSQEKNQATLIDAFALFIKEHPASHLYIIGSGPERKNLIEKINELELVEDVTLLGQIYNPFAFMKHCDVFALTSLYEGQSMVLLEALTLGMKCVSTDIPACRKVLEDGEYGVLTKTNDAKGVKEGLEELTFSKNNFKIFDAYKYNKEALQMFCNLL